MRSSLFILIICLLASPAQATQLPNTHGIWMRDDGNARVRIAPCGKELCATNLWIRDTSKGEAVGDKIVMMLKVKSATSFSGKAYDPKRGVSYSITLTVGRNSLTTRGCLLGGLVCKSVYWTPAK